MTHFEPINKILNESFAWNQKYFPVESALFMSSRLVSNLKKQRIYFLYKQRRLLFVDITTHYIQCKGHLLKAYQMTQVIRMFCVWLLAMCAWCILGRWSFFQMVLEKFINLRSPLFFVWIAYWRSSTYFSCILVEIKWWWQRWFCSQQNLRIINNIVVWQPQQNRPQRNTIT